MTITFSNLSEVTVEEFITDVLDVNAMYDNGDEDTGFEYILDDGGDSDNFTIDADTGILSFKIPPDFSDPSDHGKDNVYNLSVAVTYINDTHLSQDITIIVTGEDDYRPSYNLSNLDGSNGFVVNGHAAGDYGGWSVSSAGDLNGDGYGDVIIGAYHNDDGGGDSGTSYVVFGFKTEGAVPSVIDISSLDGSNGFKLVGNDDGNKSGFSVSGAGDVNGDGLDDIIIGTPFANDGGGTNSGTSYVVFGQGQGGSYGEKGVVNLSDLDGSDGFKITGNTDGSQDRSGWSVSSAGDVNKDGFGDLIIGAHQADRSYLVFGFNNSDLAKFDLKDTENSFVLLSGAADSKTGYSVSSAGDINGDGYADLVIGAYDAIPSGGKDRDPPWGETYVVFGSPDFKSLEDIDLSNMADDRGFTLISNAKGYRVGWSVSNAGDVNGDGYDDIIIGATGVTNENGDESGAAYVIFGRDKNSPFSDITLSALDGSNGFLLKGFGPNENVGVSVAGVGDLNGDGFDDVIIGSSLADISDDPSDEDAGESYIVFGFNNNPNTGGTKISAIELSSLDGSQGFALQGSGAEAEELSGRSVAGAGDINGDGFADLIIGAPKVDNSDGAVDAGASYIIYGGNGLLAADIIYSEVDISEGGGSPNDHSTKPTASLAAAQTTPTPGDDRLALGRDDDVVPTGDGDDYADGGNGNDMIGGGQGNDTVEGGDGDDTLFGGDGNDVLYAGSEDGTPADHGNNVIWAGNGNDTVFGSAGADTLGGGGGDDNVTSGRGNDRAFGGEGNDTVTGDQGFDTLYGGDGDDLVSGGAHSDLLFGGDGDDAVQGGSGNDTLWGGSGDDQLSGGIGADTFGFTLTGGNDTITDFDLGDDMLDLSQAGFTGLDAVTSAAEDTDDGLLITLSDSTSVLFTGLTLSDLNAMDITYI